MMLYGLYFDPTYTLVVIGLIITLIASANVNATFKKYDKVQSRRGITGAMAARKILDANGLENIRIERVSGNLTDHYSPKEGVIRLSDATYNSTSIAALGVAAHECGHAVQHEVGYTPIKLRNSMVPVVNICSYAAIPIILLGLFISQQLAMFGVILYCAVFAFQLVTLPTETNASSRAIDTLYNMAILDEDELRGTKKVLRAAAMTYFASAAATALQVLRLFLLVGGNNRRRD